MDDTKGVRIQDDLYHYVNGAWLEKAVIPDDRPYTGGFGELDMGVEKIMMGDFAAFASGKKAIPDDYLEESRSLLSERLRHQTAERGRD
jgi:predicted metalloendopeptidase